MSKKFYSFSSNFGELLGAEISTANDFNIEKIMEGIFPVKEYITPFGTIRVIRNPDKENNEQINRP